uniref:tRNA pseudouridine synthase n=2 Tax=Sphenodon punctatus TaxID=8508 RepID=A0A8D0HGY3_SPHPU
MKVPPQEVAKGILGVQNHLEKAAEKLRSITPIKFFISSRTDTGVHALCNSAHIDIERAAEKPPFSESILAQALNFHLQPEPIHHLNLSAMEEAAQFLLGTHDFSTFRSINSDADIRSPVKTLLQADARPIASFMSHHCEHSWLRFWELEFRS